jgi:fructokinase
MILCCGEALIDFVPIEDGRGYRPYPGGSIYNIAVGLGRLETPVGLFTKISTDFFGQLLVDYLIENYVDTGSLLRAEGPTTLAFVSLPGEGVYEPQYVFYANQTTDRCLALDDLPSRLPDEINALHFGSISLLLEPGASTLEALMQRESGERILSLDPNIRPTLIHDRDTYRTRFETWLTLVDLIRLSMADLEWLYPGAEPETLIQGWLKTGPVVCLLTRGAEGASGYTAGGVAESVDAPRIRVADTVGAGDTFLAAALSYLHRQGFLAHRRILRDIGESQMRACLAYAARAAAINCSRPGANPPYLHEMDDV